MARPTSTRSTWLEGLTTPAFSLSTPSEVPPSSPLPVWSPDQVAVLLGQVRDLLARCERALEAISPLRPRDECYRAVIFAVADSQGVGRDEILGHSRLARTFTARAMAMLLLRQVYGLSYHELARMFGLKSHATAIHALRTMRDRMVTEPTFSAEVERVLSLATRHS